MLQTRIIAGDLETGPFAEVKWDEWVVWVNKAVCVGRFCRISAEAMVDRGEEYPAFSTVLNNEGLDAVGLRTHWDQWVQMMLDLEGVVIPEEAMPRYIQ